MTLRLRCIRCGDWHEMDPFGESVGLGVICSGWCVACRVKLKSLRNMGVSWHRRYALMRRSQRNMGRHPTYKALAALEGTLDDNHDVLRAVMRAD